MQLGIGFGSASHWLRKWHEFCQPITERSKAKLKGTQLTLDTQFKTADVGLPKTIISFSYISRNVEALSKGH